MEFILLINLSFRTGFLKNTVECKVSRIGKKQIEVPSNVKTVLQRQDLKVTGPLGELSRSYPPEVKIVRDESGLLRVSKAVDIRKANQKHGFFRILSASSNAGGKGPSDESRILASIQDGYSRRNTGKGRGQHKDYSQWCAIGEFAAAVRKWRHPEL